MFAEIYTYDDRLLEEGILKVAMEMHQDGFSLEQIAKYAKLPIERLKEYLAFNNCHVKN